ncbi:MAG: glycoside-pentoside-hexuronide (GPH):cation symporter [Clostridiales bacterium]|nr:glycoside-pentoside-hexuronide (GPH):cation symporter [Clostridiales bacterium]
MTQLQTKKLSIGTLLGYAVGQLGCSIPFNTYMYFFLFFLTNAAGIRPGIAGTISLIAVLWDAITDPIIGTLSDNLRSKFGRRRPFILGGSIPLGITLILMFTVPGGLSEAGFVGYYIIMAVLFYTANTIVVVPYFSLGAEITQDYDERTKLRVMTSFFIYLAVLVATAFPPMIIDSAMAGGKNLGEAWTLTATVFAAAAVVIILISWNFTRGKEISREYADISKQEKDNVIKAYIQALKIKPMKYTVIANIFYMIGFSVSGGVLMYCLIFVAKLEAAAQSMVLATLPIATIILLPLIGVVSKKLGKKNAYILMLSITAGMMFIFPLVGIWTLASMMVFQILMSVGNGTFWTLCYSMSYDSVEVDEFVNGKRREGIFTSFMSFAQKCGSALAMLISGLALEYVGYDGTAEVQTDTAISGLGSLLTWVSGIFVLLSIIFIIIYPLTKDRFAALTKALEAKKAGQEYSTEGFEKLL